MWNENKLTWSHMMKANDIYRNLSTEPWWAAQTQAVRWLASRYYAGVDSVTELWALTKPIPISRDYTLKPVLDEVIVREIIRSR